MNWNDVGKVAPRSLSQARLQLHYGALILGSVAHSLLEAAEDDSHTNLGFDTGELAFFTRPLNGDSEIRVELHAPSLSLVVREKSAELARLPLHGQTLRSALTWTANALGRATNADLTVTQRTYPDFPDSPIMNGGTFEQPADADLQEIADWFGNALGLFERLADRRTGLSSIRIWPHHFDLGALLTIDAGEGRMIGLGLSPGDGSYDQPYFYASPYPQPATEKNRPTLPIGQWHTTGFVSAIATAEELLTHSSPAEAANRYLEGALTACESILA